MDVQKTHNFKKMVFGTTIFDHHSVLSLGCGVHIDFNSDLQPHSPKYMFFSNVDFDFFFFFNFPFLFLIIFCKKIIYMFLCVFGN